MYYNDWFLAKMAEEQRRELMRNLEHDRLVRLAQSTSTPRGNFARVSNGLGQLLIKSGGRLQAGMALLYVAAVHVTYHARSKPHTHTHGG